MILGAGSHLECWETLSERNACTARVERQAASELLTNHPQSALWSDGSICGCPGCFLGEGFRMNWTTVPNLFSSDWFLNLHCPIRRVVRGGELGCRRVLFATEVLSS